MLYFDRYRAEQAVRWQEERVAGWLEQAATRRRQAQAGGRTGRAAPLAAVRRVLARLGASGRARGQRRPPAVLRRREEVR